MAPLALSLSLCLCLCGHPSLPAAAILGATHFRVLELTQREGLYIILLLLLLFLLPALLCHTPCPLPRIPLASTLPCSTLTPLQSEGEPAHSTLPAAAPSASIYTLQDMALDQLGISLGIFTISTAGLFLLYRTIYLSLSLPLTAGKSKLPRCPTCPTGRVTGKKGQQPQSGLVASFVWFRLWSVAPPLTLPLPFPGYSPRFFIRFFVVSLGGVQSRGFD